MVADTAITGVAVPLQQPECGLKIVPAIDGRALIGFAGEPTDGFRLIHAAAALPAGSETVRTIAEWLKSSPSVSIAYAYLDDAEPHLVSIDSGHFVEKPTLHLGVDEAFEHFQRARHDPAIDPVPEAIAHFVCVARDEIEVPDALVGSIHGLMRVFVERSERDVGGWPLAYVLSTRGLSLCNYSYSVSDPVLKTAVPGSAVPHGSAEEGGFSLSVTDFDHGRGVVVYWLQKPGGTVYVCEGEGYNAYSFDGRPCEFKERVLASLGKPIDVFVSDQSIGRPDRILMLRDENGDPCMAIAQSGRSFSVSVLNVATPFRTRASFTFGDFSPDREMKMTTKEAEISMRAQPEQRKALLTIRLRDATHVELELTADELSEFISMMGLIRSNVPDPVAAEPCREAGTQEMVVPDPSWRTETSPHSSVPGIILRLRHWGFGWLTFLLPPHEVRNLGKYLASQYPEQDEAPPEA